MQPHLRQLGINRSGGDSLDWSDIKHAYFAKARLAHPDKNGSAEWFHNIKNALDRLEQQIFSEQSKNQQKYHAQWQDFFGEAYRGFDRIMTRAEAGIAELNETYDELENNLHKQMLRQKEVEKLLLEYARQNNISLPDELLPGPISQSKVFSNPHCPGFFGSQPAARLKQRIMANGIEKLCRQKNLRQVCIS